MQGLQVWAPGGCQREESEYLVTCDDKPSSQEGFLTSSEQH